MTNENIAYNNTVETIYMIIGSYPTTEASHEVVLEIHSGIKTKDLQLKTRIDIIKIDPGQGQGILQRIQDQIQTINMKTDNKTIHMIDQGREIRRRVEALIQDNEMMKNRKETCQPDQGEDLRIIQSQDMEESEKTRLRMDWRLLLLT